MQNIEIMDSSINNIQLIVINLKKKRVWDPYHKPHTNQFQFD